MGVAVIPRTRQIARYDELENGKTSPNAAETFALLVDATAIGAGLNDTSTKIDILRREVRPSGNGYGRRRSGRVISASAGNVLTSAGHGLPNGMPIYFAVTPGGNMVSGLVAGTRYFVVNATADTFQVATVANGTPLTLGGLSSGVVVCKPTGSYSTGNRRNESLIDIVRFQGAGAGYTYGGIAIMKGASPFSAVVVNNFNSASSQLTITGGHNLTTGDELFLMLDSGAVIPTGLTALTSYFARSVSTTVFTLHPTAAEATANTNQVLFTANGSGTIWMSYARGELDCFEVFSTSVAVANGDERPFNISRYEMNTGNAVGI